MSRTLDIKKNLTKNIKKEEKENKPKITKVTKTYFSSPFDYQMYLESNYISNFFLRKLLNEKATDEFLEKFKT
jgi:hypothetical protein